MKKSALILTSRAFMQRWSVPLLAVVTAPRPNGRGFQILRQQPARGRIYASLHWQEPTVLRLLV